MADGAHDRDQGTRGERDQAREHEEEGGHAEPERDRRRLDLPRQSPQLHHLVDRPVRGEGHAGDRGQLGADHDQRDAGHVAHEDRLREEVGEEPEPQHERGDADGADEQGQPRRERDVALRVAGGDRRHGGGDHDGRRGFGPDRQLAGRPEQRVGDHRDDRDPQPGHRLDAREVRVRQALRDEVGRDGDPGQRVGAEPARVVAAQLREPGGDAWAGPRPGDAPHARDGTGGRAARGA